jgi:hypothetical protein
MFRLALAMSLVAVGSVAAVPLSGADPLTIVLQRASERVEHFFQRAQSIVCLELVRLQPLTAGWSSEGLGRTVESELRLSWEPATDGKAATEARTLRQLLKVNGGKPRKNDWRNCTAPEQQTHEPQPLSLLLSSQREDYRFTLGRETVIDRRRAIVIDYRLVKQATVESHMLEGRDDCISFNVEGGMRGRLWVDAETFDVLRLDQNLNGMVEIPLPRAARHRASFPASWTMERLDTTIRFRAVRFENPDETLVLPESLSTIRVMRGSGTPRLRTTIEYRNYQRFLTGGRVVGN